MLIVILGVMLFAFSPSGLYRAFIFFIPFTATAAINYEGGANHWLPAVNFLGLLCLARELLGVAARGRVKLPWGRGRYIVALLVFFAVAGISLFMPWHIAGEVQVITADIDPTTYPVLSDLGVKRIASVAVEPSLLAQSLLVGLPFLLIAVWQRRPLLSARKDRYALFFLLATLMLSASSSAYLGIAFTLVVALLLTLMSRGIEWRPLAWIGGVVAVSLAIYAAVPA